MLATIVASLFGPAALARSHEMWRALRIGGESLVAFATDLVRDIPPLVGRDPREVTAAVQILLQEAGANPFRLLDVLAAELVTERDGFPALRLRGGPVRGVPRWRELGPENPLLVWRELVHRMDPTPLLAARMVAAGVEHGHPVVLLERRLSVADLPLSAELLEGLAETHLHLAAAHSFGTVVRRILAGGFEEWRRVIRMLRGKLAPELSCTMDKVVVALLALRAFLASEMGAAGPGGSRSRGLVAADRAVRKAFEVVRYALQAGDEPFLASFTERFDEGWLGSLRGYLAGTPSGGLACLTWPGTVGNEIRFLMESLRRVFSTDPRGPGWLRDGQALLTYLQLKNALYRSVVLRPGHPGFSVFRQHYDRMKATAPAVYEGLLAVATDPQLRELEIRINPEGYTEAGLARRLATVLRIQRILFSGGEASCPYINECQTARRGAEGPSSLTRRSVNLATGQCPRLARDLENLDIRLGDLARDRLFRGLERGERCRIGIVPHFIKRAPTANCHFGISDPPEIERGGNWLASPSRRGESLPKSEGRFSFLLPHTLRALGAAMTLRRLLEQIPELSDFVVGIDVANTETAIPNEVFFPVYRLLRSAWRLGGSGSPRQSIGFTYHCGEDFFDLVSGLRTIWEVVELFHFLPGDRLGHAFAAGVEPALWVSGHDPAFVPLEELIWNRVWIWRFCRDNRIDWPGLTELESWIEHEAQCWLGVEGLAPTHLIELFEWRFEAFLARVLRSRESEVLLGPSVVDEEMQRLRDRVGDPERLSGLLGEPVTTGYWEFVGRAFRSYFERPQTYQRGRRVCVVRHENRAGELRQLQRLVCEVIAERGVAVEVNITSNCVIAGLSGPRYHPVFEWKSKDGELNTGFRVTLNTDNISVFATSLETEYALLFLGALQRGASRDAAEELVATVRRESRRASFIRRRYSSDEAELRALCEVIDRLDRHPAFPLRRRAGVP